MVKGHPVAGDEDARAVIAVVTMHKDFFLWICAKQGKELGDLLVCRGRPSAHGDGHEAKPGRLRFVLLPTDSGRVLAAKIHDGTDAQLFQLQQSALSRLRAAIQLVADFPRVGDTGDTKLLSERGMRHSR